jgi:hypothetical protein
MIVVVELVQFGVFCCRCRHSTASWWLCFCCFLNVYIFLQAYFLLPDQAQGRRDGKPKADATGKLKVGAMARTTHRKKHIEVSNCW